MKYAIFSDIHGNLEAYQSLLKALGREGVSKYFCVGDIVGYGADPRACIELTKKIKAVVIAGNHDWASIEKMSVDYFNDCAKRAVLWTSSVLKDTDREYLGGLGLTYEDRDLTMVHGALMNPEIFDYVIDFATAYQMLKMMQNNIGFIGHSHVPGLFILRNEKVEHAEGSKVKISKNAKYLVNVGSVGQPRDGDPRGSYCIWDKKAGTIQIKRAEYDICAAQKKIVKAGLPDFLARRLSEGR